VTSVLVVDDDFMVARLNARFVERTDGFEVVGVAANGEEAIALCAALDPDLVLLDVHLPDLGGLQVLARLREAGSRAGVIMVTAERDADTVRAAVAGGAMQYVVKPFEQHDLAERLHRVRNALLALGEGDADQATIDRAFGAARSPSRVAPLPKGLSRETAQLVEGLLEQDEEVSSSDAAERLGLSRVTARRYLEHFVTTGEAQVRLRYGGAGRPERRYRRP
jgi:response regulator of citrate/malate metabolism